MCIFIYIYICTHVYSFFRSSQDILFQSILFTGMVPCSRSKEEQGGRGALDSKFQQLKHSQLFLELYQCTQVMLQGISHTQHSQRLFQAFEKKHQPSVPQEAQSRHTRIHLQKAIYIYVYTLSTIAYISFKHAGNGFHSL